MGWFKKAIKSVTKGLTNVIGEVVGAPIKVATGGKIDPASDMRDLQRLIGVRDVGAQQAQQPQQSETERLMQEYMGMMEEYMGMISESMNKVTPAQEPLKTASDQMGFAKDDTAKRMAMRNGLLSLTRFDQGTNKLGV